MDEYTALAGFKKKSYDDFRNSVRCMMIIRQITVYEATQYTISFTDSVKDLINTDIYLVVTLIRC